LTTKLTANAGASRTRASIKARLIRLKQIKQNHVLWGDQLLGELEELIEFIDGQAARASAKKGGLGRK